MSEIKEFDSFSDGNLKQIRGKEVPTSYNLVMSEELMLTREEVLRQRRNDICQVMNE